MRPVEKRILDEALHRFGELDELVVPGGVARDILLLDAIRAHLAPLVVVAAQPNLRDIRPALVLGNLARRQMAVVVDDRHILGVAMVKLAGRLGGQEEVVVDECHFECPFVAV